MASFILSIDQGTTGSTAMVLDKRLRVLAKVNREFPQHFTGPGQVEHDLEDIWKSVQFVAKKALAASGVKGRDIAAIGLTNQRETTALFERESGHPLARAIVWQDRRTAPMCDALKAAGHEPMVQSKTGLVLDPYFSGTKMRWLLDNVPGARARAERGDAVFGTIDTFLVHRLTGGAAHVTDVTNASRTLLMDLGSLAWDPALIELLGVPAAALPRIVPSSGVVGVTKGLRWLPDGVPVAGIAGDQQAALAGQACFEPGEAKCTYGTGAFLLMNTGRTPVASRHGLLTTVAWQMDGETAYALEGSAFIAGAAVQWLRDGLGIIKKAADVEALAATVKDSGGVTFVPALAGLGAPHWRPEARGLFTGLERGTTKGHLARAVLEGVAFQVGDLLDAMRRDSGRDVPVFKVDGGAAQNDLLMQFQADVLATPLERPKMLETTALGAAFLAGLGVGVWKSRDDVRKAWKKDARFTPRMSEGARTAHLERWREAVKRA
ncbi:MAG: Glycerol kinase [Pseudomonadota bacterium]|jgi:glycerol kinase